MIAFIDAKGICCTSDVASDKLRAEGTNTHNIGTTKPLEIALPADQQASKKYSTNTVHRELKRKRSTPINPFTPKFKKYILPTFPKRNV